MEYIDGIIFDLRKGKLTDHSWIKFQEILTSIMSIYRNYIKSLISITSSILSYWSVLHVHLTILNFSTGKSCYSTPRQPLETVFLSYLNLLWSTPLSLCLLYSDISFTSREDAAWYYRFFWGRKDLSSRGCLSWLWLSTLMKDVLFLRAGDSRW